MLTRLENFIALFCFVAAKFCGLIGVCLSFSNFRTLSMSLLITAFICLIICILMCIIMLRKSEKSESDINVLKRIMSEGKLDQYLKDICQS